MRNPGPLTRALACACAAALVACGAANRGGAPAANESSLVATNLIGPPGGTLVTACTPTGPELCFNAIDDNCNGVIDEGCGVGTGVLQFTIAWSEAAADVDLIVTEPSGARVSEQNRQSPSGLHLDRDCPGEGCNGQNTENIYFEGLEPKRGHYVVEIRLADLHGAQPPIVVHYGARIGAKTQSGEVSLSQSDEKKTYSFDL